MHGGYIDGTTAPAASCGATNGTAIVGTHLPNDWGLYDMHGNVWEWCLDWYEEDITENNGEVNIDYTTPANTLSGASGAYRVPRGGSWNNTADMCRPAYRLNYTPAGRSSGIGFRLLCFAGLQ